MTVPASFSTPTSSSPPFYSAARRRGVLGLVVDASVQGFVSLAILDEVRDVLPKVQVRTIVRTGFRACRGVHDLCCLVTPTTRVRVIRADPSDNMVLETAQAASADTIVSGDRHLLNLEVWNGIRIVSPADFVESMTDHAEAVRRGRDAMNPLNLTIRLCLKTLRLPVHPRCDFLHSPSLRKPKPQGPPRRAQTRQRHDVPRLPAPHVGDLRRPHPRRRRQLR